MAAYCKYYIKQCMYIFHRLATKNKEVIIKDLIKLCTSNPEDINEETKAYKIPLVKKKIADGVFSSRIFTPDTIEDEQVLNE